jgi:hypothetical protein
MFPDISPIIVFGMWCFCILVGLMLGLVAFFITDWRWWILLGAALGQCGFFYLKLTVLRE